MKSDLGRFATELAMLMKKYDVTFFCNRGVYVYKNKNEPDVLRLGFTAMDVWTAGAERDHYEHSKTKDV